MQYEEAYAMKSIVVVANVVDNLSIDQVSGDHIEVRVVPWSKQLLAVVQSPGGARLEPTLTANHLFTFTNGVHHVIKSTAQ